MNLNEPLPNDIRKIIDSFLDQVDTTLLNRAVPRDQRTSIVGELESQIITVIERKLVSGSELTSELVQGIIDTMDPPASYGVEDVEKSTPIEPVAAVADKAPPRLGPAFRKLFGWVTNRRQEPHIDDVVVVGNVIGGLGAFLLAIGILSHTAPLIVLSVFIIAFSSLLGFVSWYRIRRSKGRLLGLKRAFINAVLPAWVAANLMLVSLCFVRPIGILISVLMIGAALGYANYRLARLAWSRVQAENDHEPSKQTGAPKSTSSLVLDGSLAQPT